MYKKFLTTSVVLFSACSTPAYRASEVPVPATYGVARATAAANVPVAAIPDSAAQAVYLSHTVAPAPFWSELGDTVLVGLVREAQRANMDVRVAQSRVMSARASKRLAAFDLVPTVTGIGSASRVQQSAAQIPGLTSQLPAQQLWDVGFDASWELDVFGRVGRRVRAQSALVESSEEGLGDMQVTVAAEVARTYFELRGAQRQLAVAQQNANNQRETVKLTENRLGAGSGTAFDTERAKSILYLTLASTPLLESQIAQDRNRIAVLLGRSPDALPAALIDSGVLPRLPDTLYVASPDQLVRHRPDVLQAERQLAARSLFVGAARAEYLPRITLSAQAGYVGTSADSVFKRGNSRLLVGPVLTFPLFDIGRVRERVQVAQADEQEAEAQYNSTVLRALEESESSLVAYDRAHARLAILEDAVKSSERASDLAKQRFEAGLTDFLQVLDAERTLLDAENQLAEGRTTAAVALVAVYKSVGGAFPARTK
ncbi:MAG TPA: efflux transporter outer membrane subunit [Gemmatimonadaceae bacterium]|nr:efflux transporter outer membrane subunit [Gemmatimonadaceae bacterium]